ncbi:cell envelope integrity protein CreD [Budvicia diplopodorum]|uniref:cell envelope integrity protein CreD n=1 Tax=Budvicia diplopodorum TaxID=1119056 RepID=UPI00135A6C7D|nr:cell envelope integrity protein CreD [Budvicia diplopodorum]
MFKSTLFWKVFILLGFSVLMMIPISLVLNLIDSRHDYQQSVIQRVEDGTSGAQTIIGPILVLPYVDSTNGNVTRGQRYILPDSLHIDANVSVEPRKIGIYQTQVYQGDTHFKASFDTLDYQNNGVRVYQKPYFILALSDSRGITSAPELKINQQMVSFEAGTGSENFPQGMHADIPDSLLGLNQPVAVEFELSLQGTAKLNFMPVGRTTELSMSSNWPDPNFSGRFLPKKRSINENGFTASWQSSWLSNNINNNFEQYSFRDMNRENSRYSEYSSASSDMPTFSTSFIETVDHYQLNTRTVKYAVLFISLTFVAFFLFEMLKSLSIHPMQYLLVAAALMVFYIILLAFSERIGFAWAYCIAAISCSGLIGFYLTAVLKGILRGVVFAVGLLALYGVLYVLLQSDDNALLLGSVLLFAVLTVIMTLTRRFDWYKVAAPKPTGSESFSSTEVENSSSSSSARDVGASGDESVDGRDDDSLERPKYRLWK